MADLLADKLDIAKYLRKDKPKRRGYFTMNKKSKPKKLLVLKGLVL